MVRHLPFIAKVQNFYAVYKTIFGPLWTKKDFLDAGMHDQRFEKDLYINSSFFTAFNQFDGYESLIESYFQATAKNRSLKVPGDESSGYCGDVPADSMHLFRSIVPGESDLPWTGVSFFL